MADEHPSTQDKLVQAGIDALLEMGFGVLDRGMTIDRVAERAGTTPQTFYNHFSKSEFLERMIASLPTRHTYATEELSDEVARQLVASNGDIRPILREICKWDFDHLRDANRNSRFLYLTIALGQDDANLMRKIRNEYQEVTKSLIGIYQVVLARWGATLRAPFSTETLCVTLTAIVEGLSQRWWVEPSAVPDGLFGEIAIALIASVIDTEQRHGHIDDMIAPLANELAAQYQSSIEGDLPRDIRPTVIDAARIEFGQRGYFSTTLAHIATTAELSIATLKRLFPTKAHIIVRALKDKIEALVEQVTDDVAMGVNEKDVIQRHLSRLAAMAFNNVEYMDALLMVVAHDTWSNPEGVVAVKRELDLPGILAPVIEQGQRCGSINAAEQPYEIAAILTNTLLMRCFTRRQHSPEDVAGAVSNICLHGILSSHH